MANPSIDIEKSIRKKWLCKSGDWLNNIDKIFFILSLVCIFYSTFLLIQTKNPNSNERAIIYIFCPLLIILSFYATYRKIVENKLLVVETGLNKVNSKKILIDFINLQHYDKVVHHSDLIIATEESSLSYNGLWAKTITFIVADGVILFNIVRNAPMINPPVFFQHLFLRNRIKKLFK